MNFCSPINELRASGNPETKVPVSTNDGGETTSRLSHRASTLLEPLAKRAGVATWLSVHQMTSLPAEQTAKNECNQHPPAGGEK
jgi:hypothetical protein